MRLTVLPVALTTLLLANPVHSQTYTYPKYAHREDSSRDQRHRVGHLDYAPGHLPIDESYAGFIDIRHWNAGNGVQGNASLFYWFFPALNATRPDPPLIIWFQGGPGSASMIGLFYEMGPVHADEALRLTRNPHSWANDYSMVFIDQPVGTGYSYVEPIVPVALPSPRAPTSVPHHQHLFHFRTNSSNQGFNAGDGSAESYDGYFGQTPILDEDEQARAHSSGDSDYSHGYVINQAGVTKDLLVFLDAFYERRVLCRQIRPLSRVPDPRAEQARPERYGIPLLAPFVNDITNPLIHSLRLLVQPDQCIRVVSRRELAFVVLSLGCRISPVSLPLLRADNLSSPRFISLAGIAVGNGLTDPTTQLKTHGPQGFELGVLGSQQAREVDRLADEAIEQIKAGTSPWYSTSRVCSPLSYHIFFIPLRPSSRILYPPGQYAKATDTRLAVFALFTRYTGGLNWYDVRKGDHLNNYTLMDAFMNDQKNKVPLHVQDDGRKRDFWKDLAVAAFLKEDITLSTAHLFPVLLAHYRVLLYQGQFDFRDGVAGNTAWIEALEWPGREGFANAPRNIWKTESPTDRNSHVAGWVQAYANLTRLSLFGAGHMAPMDQPANTREMISNFIEGRPWTAASENSF
ncbi:Alpha/Beta hydrolase protein [Jimgerdemannia flammicorona]|uniref:Alpha/Beta hydrolase protein n=1 Tax=Jimgerdemannia flammicorona TaxID=994334 RepID=A0A433QNS2_9FUNG|nr:Alpha/Beta hydrolase protein [Jimgerdemannia flammicorona]